MLRITVLVSGGGTNLQAIIDAIAAGDIHNAGIVRVISNNPNAYALTRAQNAGIEAVCISPKSYPDREQFHKALLRAIDEADTGLVVLAGCMVVLPAELISAYRGRIINIHPALIPSFCGKGFYGLHVHEEVLARGVKVTGATVHFVDEGTDTGPIILQKAVEVHDDDTPETLQRRVMEEAEWKIMPQAIDLIAQGRVRIEGGRTFIDPQD
ncbi:MAG: phosphoribosylglycinamide formyltransferase [Lachnospiraceae bacterium]|nr:phosphoribosylglycinamide formyltransferase [Lachnospiraceae bacterium]